jgi:hypothetical protein
MKIALQSLASVGFGLVFFGLALFWPAGTFHYWQAWVFIFVFIFATMGPSLYLAVKMPDALQRRMKAGPFAETRPLQKLIMVGTIGSDGRRCRQPSSSSATFWSFSASP